MKTQQDKERFIELRAKGYSYNKISELTGLAKQTLVDWNADLEERISNLKAIELEALYEQYQLLKEDKIRNFGAILSKITEELNARDFTKVPTGRLLELYLLYYEKASSEIVEPSFKTSEQIAEEQEAKQLLNGILAIEAA
jgi:hypothetical protein